MVRMAEGTQKPGMLGAWAQAGQKRNWLSGQPQEQMVLEGRRGGARRNKSNPDGPGNCGRGEGGRIDTQQGRGPERRALAPVEADRTAGRLKLCAHGSEMSQACQKTAWPLLAPAGPVSYQARQFPHQELWGCLLYLAFPSRDPSLSGPRTP